jgi:hypothetical protein
MGERERISMRLKRGATSIVFAILIVIPWSQIAVAEPAPNVSAASDQRPLAPLAPPSTATGGQPTIPGALSDRVASYSIRAVLDPTEGAKTVTGTERITWRNPSDVPVKDLWFHLYLNAFRDRRSTFMKGSGGQLRGDSMPEGRFGHIDVTSLKTAAGEDLLERLEFVQPDDGNVDDRSVARVELTQAVAPGQTIEVDVGFVSTLPGVFARTGYKDNFFFVGQWFPKLGVFEPRGVRGRSEPGWNCHQFHPNSEFYADFGSYEVEITTPAKFVVGATGSLVREAPNADGTTTRLYKQDDVHDFAWTADDDYVVGSRTYSEPGFPEVRITALVQPEHGATVERHLDACVASLSWFNRNIGPYPYATLTVVDPQEGADGAGGMEYPTLITAGIATPVSGDTPQQDDPLLELVIFHEFGHQYWYGMVASNEFEEPWLDEGINSYTESLGLDEIWPNSRSFYVVYGNTAICRIPFDVPVIGRSIRFAALPRFVRRGPLINTSWGFGGNYSYGVNTYYRTAVVMNTLRGLLGEETMATVMRVYFDRWKFRHPTSRDFFAVASEVSQQNLDWFIDQYFRSDRVLDYGVQNVTETKVDALEGASAPTLVSTIILERVGDGVFPVTADVTFEDGTTQTINWDGQAAQATFKLESAGSVTKVEIDPKHLVMLDANRTNNSHVARTDVAGPMRIASQYSLFLQHALLVLAGGV